MTSLTAPSGYNVVSKGCGSRSTHLEHLVCECHVQPYETSCTSESLCVNVLFKVECDESNCRSRFTCQNRRFKESSRPNVIVRTTTGAGLGLYAPQPIPAGYLVFEYVGEVINEEEYRRRTAALRSHSYIMSLQLREYIDATNAETWSVEGQARLGIFAMRDILPQESITFDYTGIFPGPPTTCHCDTSLCGGLFPIPRDQIEDNPAVEQTRDRFRCEQNRDYRSERRLEDLSRWVQRNKFKLGAHKHKNGVPLGKGKLLCFESNPVMQGSERSYEHISASNQGVVELYYPHSNRIDRAALKFPVDKDLWYPLRNFLLFLQIECEAARVHVTGLTDKDLAQRDAIARSKKKSSKHVKDLLSRFIAESEEAMFRFQKKDVPGLLQLLSSIRKSSRGLSEYCHLRGDTETLQNLRNRAVPIAYADMYHSSVSSVARDHSKRLIQRCCAYGELAPEFLVHLNRRIFLLNREKTFYDAGCGFGNALWKLSMLSGCRSIGVEMASNLVSAGGIFSLAAAERCHAWGFPKFPDPIILHGDMQEDPTALDFMKTADAVLFTSLVFDEALKLWINGMLATLKVGCNAVLLHDPVTGRGAGRGKPTRPGKDDNPLVPYHKVQRDFDVPHGFAREDGKKSVKVQVDYYWTVRGWVSWADTQVSYCAVKILG